jgi:hypothetical protein
VNLCAGLKGLKILQLRKIKCVLAKRKDPVGFNHLEVLQLWDMRTMDDGDVAALLSAFSEISKLSIRGECKLTEVGLYTCVDNFRKLTSLELDHDSGIWYPLSTLLDTPHSAPIVEVTLLEYSIKKVFTKETLDSLVDDDRKFPNLLLRKLCIAKQSVSKFEFGDINYALVLQALMFFLPNLEELDMSHQFVDIQGGSVEIPNNSLAKLITCKHHESVKILNVEPNVHIWRDCKIHLADVKNPLRVGREAYEDDSSSDDMGK